MERCTALALGAIKQVEVEIERTIQIIQDKDEPQDLYPKPIFSLDEEFKEKFTEDKKIKQLIYEMP